MVWHMYVWRYAARMGGKNIEIIPKRNIFISIQTFEKDKQQNKQHQIYFTIISITPPPCRCSVSLLYPPLAFYFHFWQFLMVVKVVFVIFSYFLCILNRFRYIWHFMPFLIEFFLRVFLLPNNVSWDCVMLFIGFLQSWEMKG